MVSRVLKNRSKKNLKLFSPVLLLPVGFATQLEFFDNRNSFAVYFDFDLSKCRSAMSLISLHKNFQTSEPELDFFPNSRFLENIFCRSRSPYVILKLMQSNLNECILDRILKFPKYFSRFIGIMNVCIWKFHIIFFPKKNEICANMVIKFLNNKVNEKKCFLLSSLSFFFWYFSRSTSI